DPEYDVGGIVVHPTKREIQAVSFYKDKQEWRILDQSIAEDFEAIGKLGPGEFDLTSRNLADTTWLIAYRTDDGPVYYFTYDRASKTFTFLFSNQPKLEG
ncbi:S9 family peptidase, partial [Microcoleus sp. HI-ES]|nr:S9 family peptidase [Microcoleus sp. HI-ES]